MRSATRPAVKWVAASSLVALFIACVGHLPHPDYVAQPTSALVQVGYPPPPARVEFIPAQPSKKAVWIDGEWQWQGRRWAWRIGRWVEPPADGAFAPWMMVRDADGVVYYAEGTWRNGRHEEIAEPAPLATGRPTISDVVDPEGELEQTGKSVRKSDLADASAADGEPAAEPASASPVPDTSLGDAGYQDR